VQEELLVLLVLLLIDERHRFWRCVSSIGRRAEAAKTLTTRDHVIGIGDTPTPLNINDGSRRLAMETDSTINASRHLSSNKPGHSHGPNGPIPIASWEVDFATIN
jgi:hypothetical protein